MTGGKERGYRPIHDYALIGDAHTAALVAKDGSIDWCCWPTFDYARADTTLDACEGGAVATAGREALALTCPAQMRRDESGALVGRFKVKEGERVWVALNYFPDARSEEVRPPRAESDDELKKTLSYWGEWWHACRYEGPYSEQVRRSALVLKLLTYEPTGALVAAPTTSLPEEVGGVRNWDYRYPWLRDSSLILYTLMLLGYHDEAADFFDWLDGLGIPRGNHLQIMYTLDGSSFPAE